MQPHNTTPLLSKARKAERVEAHRPAGLESIIATQALPGNKKIKAAGLGDEPQP